MAIKAIGAQKSRGRGAILRAIRDCGPVARIELAAKTGISRATVTAITAEFLRDGLIEEIQPDATDPALKAGARGRPRVDLKLRGQAHLVAGMKISNRSISVALVDFEGALFGEAHAPLDHSVMGAAALAERLAHVLNTATRSAGIAASDLSAVGIGISGVVDATRGFVYWSPSLSDRNLPFGDIVAARLGLPVFLDNDANLVALAEQSFGLGRGMSDFIVVTIESGVGMGIVLGNEIYRGTRGCGAEFGHTKVQLDGALCRCGQRGCLEAYVADYALLRETDFGGDTDKSIPAEQQIEALLRAARSGEPTAKTIIDRAGRMFAMGLANLVNIFDPQLIILSGERMQLDHLYATEVIAAIRTSSVQIDKAPPEVKIHKWGDLMWTKGAAAFALGGVIEHVIGEKPDHAR